MKIRLRQLKFPIICCLLVVSMLFSSVWLPISSSLHSQQAQQYANNDTVLICTGDKFKWISLSATQSAGQLVFVSAPQETPEAFQTIDCSWGMLAEPAYQATMALTTDAHFHRYLALKIRLYKRAYHHFAYRTKLSRAPPLIA